MLEAFQNHLWTITTHHEQQTCRVGEAIGGACQGGEIFLLAGPLGAGKTCLTGGILRGLGLDRPAASPSYVILRSYETTSGLTLHHFDFYRLSGIDDLETIGLEECLSEDAVVVAEWPDRCPEALEVHTMRLELEVIAENERRIRAAPGGLEVGVELIDLKARIDSS